MLNDDEDVRVFEVSNCDLDAPYVAIVFVNFFHRLFLDLDVVCIVDDDCALSFHWGVFQLVFSFPNVVSVDLNDSCGQWL